MKVSEAVKLRKSVRAFIDKPVLDSDINEILKNASRAPSGGNLQPWKIYVVNGKSMTRFLEFQNSWTGHDIPEYEIYPKKLQEPYRTSRYELGEEMYSLLGISKEDKEARIGQVLKNFNFFNAPAGLFCFIDRSMGNPQWSDLGMFLQTFMLLATEKGISTCSQEAWSIKPQCVSSFVNAPESLMLFCGMAIGYEDKNSPVNTLRSSRRPLEDWVSFLP
jgi:nitroreductase